MEKWNEFIHRKTEYLYNNLSVYLIIVYYWKMLAVLKEASECKLYSIALPQKVLP